MISNRIYTNGIFLLAGSNLFDRLMFIQNAEKQLIKLGFSILGKSSLYETDPWGTSSEHSYLNQAWEINSFVEPDELLNVLKEIEFNLGRSKQTERYADRCIDLDILYFSDQVVSSEKLQIPHPRIPERRFVLVPMAELAPEFLHPAMKVTQEELLKNCRDKLQVSRFSPRP